MSYLIAIKFDGADDATKVRESLRSVEKSGHLSLDDSAVIVKDADGKVHIKDEMDRGVKVGALGGSLLGLLIGGLIFPIGGLVLGALGGALVGKTMDTGVDKKFIKDVQASMEPGTSALFFIVRDADPNVALAALRQYEGQVFQTSLPTEMEEQLRETLKKKS